MGQQCQQNSVFIWLAKKRKQIAIFSYTYRYEEIHANHPGLTVADSVI